MKKNNLVKIKKISLSLALLISQVFVYNFTKSIEIWLIYSTSLTLGLIRYGSVKQGLEKDCEKEKMQITWQLKFIEFWNICLNYFIAGATAYYFLLLRLPQLVEGALLNVTDFGLFLIFAIAAFGHLCTLSNNITKGINAILSRVLEQK